MQAGKVKMADMAVFGNCDNCRYSKMDHSDSDSGESWTLLDHTPAHAEVPDFPDRASELGRGDLRVTNEEKDDDTDGISIISDSEPESPILHEIDHKQCNDVLETERDVSSSPIQSAYIDDTVFQESNDDDFLGNSSSKHKTYVHKRNKRLSMVLNIIVLGSVITAAGVAIGHMWGAKNDCTVNKMPSVNKILSNLYKLQEENAYLRSKLKEYQMNYAHLNGGKSATEKLSYRQNKCKKVFEDSINNRNSDKSIKCVDNEEKPKTGIHLIELEQGNQFLQEINKLKDIYNQNKTWLDYEIGKRLKAEEKCADSTEKKIRFKSTKLEKNKHHDQKHAKVDLLESISEIPTTNTNSQFIEDIGIPVIKDEHTTDYSPEKKISYADSLKSDVKLNNILRTDLDITTEKHAVKAINNEIKESNINLDTTGYSVSEEEFKKDNRYIEKRHKKERKKYDRQKLHKKQKRKNKYEQWELKGGYLRDYDDISISSTQENEDILNIPDIAIERDNYVVQENKFNPKSSELKDVNTKAKMERKSKHGKNIGNKEKDTTWFEKRADFRNQARKKLEQELFGQSSQNNAGWYFRRMHRREQCRTKGDNSTYRKLSKRNMNFKMKY
ncbi:hypothetical protein evm_005433 [Chilo suppressalis]|nr:hypothetical protein evm_005433 [Chilo suppressalis]